MVVGVGGRSSRRSALNRILVAGGSSGGSRSSSSCYFCRCCPYPNALIALPLTFLEDFCSMFDVVFP